MRTVICLMVLALSVSACGYKGGLYLPKDGAAPSQESRQP
ncbi:MULTISPECIES: LPS translocon maturation chaperone LptM [Crenobacter]|uniref:Lipoprotein n=2 Tax=Crenobacter TaxID=1654931 RepID=A0A4T0V453_9NEIS|nr:MULTISPECIES: lipoprotein [Crenobacter]NDV11264.1 lipoprotein [Crenobacter caeni]TIC86025.1 hypothetical protein E5K04_02675 [Crenobacter intestini]